MQNQKSWRGAPGTMGYRAGGMNARTNTDSLHLKHMLTIPKHKYIRSLKLLKIVAGLDCQQCGYGSSQAAHSNWGGGKGRGIKADDNLVAALCLRCHFQIDQGKDLTREQRQEMWTLAHKRTIKTLLEMDLWPKNVPIPIVADK